MPKGPKGQRRPADVIGNAIKVAKIATGEIEDDVQRTAPKRAKGAQARSKSLTAEERAEIARTAASARWKRKSGS